MLPPAADSSRISCAPYPYFSNLGVATPSGRVFCSGVPFEGIAEIGDRSYFRRAVQRRGFAAGEYRIGQITGKAVINFGYPVLDDAGRIMAVVFAGLDLSWLNRLLAESRLPEESTVTVVDVAGQILAPLPPTRRHGSAAPSRRRRSFRPILSQQTEGTVEGKGLDGTPRLFAFTPAPSWGAGSRSPTSTSASPRPAPSPR